MDTNRRPGDKPVNENITPCVLAAFNRPDKLDHVLGALRDQDIDHLIVFVDGPRDEADVELVERCRAIGHVQFEVSQAMVEGMGRDGSEVFEFLSDHGYECHPISENGDLLPSVTMTREFSANFIAVPSRKWRDADED